MTKLSMSEEEMLKRKYTRPYEKRIAELEDKLANVDYQLEGRDIKIKELEAQIEEMKCCENCAFFKDKTYDICHKIKKLGTRKCAFYKMI